MFRSSHIFVIWFLVFWVTLVALFSIRFFSIALQNVNKEFLIFSYFHIFVAKGDQKPKTKYDEQNKILGTSFLSDICWKLHNRELCKVRASKFRGRTVTLIWHYSLQCSYHFWQTSLVFYNYRPRQGPPCHNGLKSILKEHFYLPRICNFSQILYYKIYIYLF